LDEENNIEDDEEMIDFLDKHNINLARAFLGYGGGYSIRQLKRLFLKDKLE
jgi:hypothetical protein